MLTQARRPIPKQPTKNVQEMCGLIDQINYKVEQQSLPFKQIAAEYFVRICVSHKFNDGNKRSAVTLLDAFYKLNNKQLRLQEADLAQVAITVASLRSADIGVEAKVRYVVSRLN